MSQPKSQPPNSPTSSPSPTAPEGIPHQDDAHAPHAPHAAAVETPEQHADRERSARVEELLARRVGRPLGALIAVAGAGVSFALLTSLASTAPPLRWTWLLVSVFATAFGAALFVGLPKPAAEAPPSAHH